MRVYVTYPDNREKFYDGDFPRGRQPVRNLPVEHMNQSVMYFWDVFEEAELQRVITSVGSPRYVVNDSYDYFHSELHPVYCVNKWLEWQLHHFERGNIQHADSVETAHCVNFSVNKSQLHRILAIRLCEYFGLDAGYSWSGLGKDWWRPEIIDLYSAVDDLEIASFMSSLDRPITAFDQQWLVQKHVEDNGGYVQDYSSVKYNQRNVHTWNSGLNRVYENSAVSLITESIKHSRSIHFSEKTAYAILGLTFPLWLGGQHQASTWKEYGFDVFDDVVDHSYQQYDNILQQCFYAVYLNLDLLTNKQRLTELRNTHMDRLKHNRELLTHAHFYNINAKRTQQWPVELQQAISRPFDIHIINHGR